MAFMSCELPNNADFYFCYVIKMGNNKFKVHEQKCDSFTQARQSSVACYYNYISFNFIFWEEPWGEGLGNYIQGDIIYGRGESIRKKCLCSPTALL